MGPSWTAEQLSQIDTTRELEIASRRRNGTLGRAQPIWVVCVNGQVYVRSWHRRTTGWFGQVIDGRARVRVHGKYAPHGDGSVGQMTTDAAAATTLRLSPAETRSRVSRGSR